MSNKNLNIIQDISLLYELSLSIGQTFELEENCTNFVKLLLERKNLDYAAVWLKSEVLPKESREGLLINILTFPKVKGKVFERELSNELDDFIQKQKAISFENREGQGYSYFLTENKIEGGKISTH